MSETGWEKWLLLVNDGFCASCSASPSVEQKVGRIMLYIFSKLSLSKKKKESHSLTFPQRKAVIIEGDNSYEGKHYIYS